MPSPPFAFSSDFEASSSPDPLLLASRLSLPQNPEFLSASETGLSALSTSHEVNRFFHSPDIPRSQLAPVLSSSSVSTLFRLQLFAYTPQKQSAPFQPTQNHSMGPYDPMISRTNNMYEEYLKMRTERDMWQVRYTELK